MVEKNFIPSDLLPYKSAYKETEIMSLSAIYLKRNFFGRLVTVGITPTLIYDAYRKQNVMITNPSPLGLGGLPSATGLVTQQVGVVGAGNSNAAPIGVGNFMDMHLFLNITAIAAGTTWSFILQVQDPITLAWADSQVLAAGVTPAIVAGWTNAELYAFIGNMGVGNQFSVRWTLDGGAGALSFTLSYILKLGTAGSSGGISQIVYLGSSDGVSVATWYPLLENSEKVFQVEEGTKIYGIARVPVVVNVLELV